MLAYVVPINWVWNSRTGCTDLPIIDWQWLLTLCNMQDGVRVCQIHANFMHQPSELLHPIVTSWPFEAWEIDVIWPISLPSARGHRFILAIIDYFSKWAKVIPLAEVKATNVINFIKYHVIHRFSVARRIIHDNGPPICEPIILLILRQVSNIK